MFNRATQALRQVGSNIKPFLYTAAMDRGLTLASILNDVPIFLSPACKPASLAGEFACTSASVVSICGPRG
ncbi:hypothetical protein HZD82_24135, partial [Pantoea agglomerans]|nr:hypothetical protein [Pantoea agglomerans]